MNPAEAEEFYERNQERKERQSDLLVLNRRAKGKLSVIRERIGVLYARLTGPTGENTKHNIRDEIKALEWAHNTLCEVSNCHELKIESHLEDKA